MKKRDTEGTHELGTLFYENVNIFELQGLLININGEFSASIEAFDMEAGEVFNVESAFTINEFKAKILLSERLDIPFYIIVYPFRADFFVIYKIQGNSNKITVESIKNYSFNDFIIWWKSLKGTIQTKPLNEAGSRIAKSKVDEILFKNGLAWGGNIDGFIISKEKDNILAILEKRVSNKFDINTYDPASFFKYRGGDYYTWLPLVRLSNLLGCPLFLLTLSKRSSEYFGLAVVDSIEPTLQYKGLPPNENLFKDVLVAKKWMAQYMDLT